MKKTRYLYLTLAILTTIFIFSNSLMPANISSEQSGFFVGLATNILEFFFIKTENINMSYLIRKGAHFIQFFMLGFFWFMYFNLSLKEPYETYIKTLSIGLITAMTDEFIQYFIPGRAMLIEDMLLDLLGVITFLFLAFLLTVLINIKKRRNYSSRSKSDK